MSTPGRRDSRQDAFLIPNRFRERPRGNAQLFDYPCAVIAYRRSATTSRRASKW